MWLLNGRFDRVRIESAEPDMRTVVEDLGPREVVDSRSTDRCYTTSMCEGDFRTTYQGHDPVHAVYEPS